jgi:hypothetical protein
MTPLLRASRSHCEAREKVKRKNDFSVVAILRYSAAVAAEIARSRRGASGSKPTAPEANPAERP